MEPATAARARRALPWVLAVLGILATLGGGFWLKEQCIEGNWHGDQGWFCYSDMGVLWHSRCFDQDSIPYLHACENESDPLARYDEYPPVTGAIQYVSALATTTHGGWIHVNQAILAACGIGTALLLAWQCRPKWRALVYCLAPSVVLYAFHNWDLAAVFLATLGLVLHARGRSGWAGGVLALGFYAKIYPALFLPIVGMDLLRQERRLGPRSWRFGLAAVGTLAGVALPFLLVARQGFLAFIEFHAQRGPTIESAWNVLVTYSSDGLRHWLDGGPRALASNAFILLALAASSWAVGVGRLPWLRACLGALAAFLLANQVMSVQYALWILPLLALVDVPLLLVGAFFVADAWTYYGIFSWEAHPDLAHFAVVAYGSTLRAFVYAGLVVYAFLGLRRRPGALRGRMAGSPAEKEAGKENAANTAPARVPNEAHPRACPAPRPS